DPGAAEAGAELGVRRRLPPAPAAQLVADALAKLRRRLVGEGEGEDRVDAQLVAEDEIAVAVDEDPGLAAAGSRLQQDVAAAYLDRLSLFAGGLANRAHESSSSSSSSGT